jgi:AmiR/NasT family two-component response regulator
MKKKIRVLLAEDEFLVGDMIAHLLTDAGYEVIGTARDGAEAVQMTRTLHPQVVVMDIEMPVMDGIEACRMIQDQSPVPVVMMTAYADPEMIESASAAGAGAYMVKPPDPGEIDRGITIAMARFKDMCDLRKLNDELRQKNHDMETLIADLQKALDHVKTLRRLLPICASCKKIRNDQGYWHMVEDYLSAHSDLVFSHGLCPDCMKRLYPDLRSEDE